MATKLPVPETILELVVDHTDSLLPSATFCAGFEDGTWRSDDLSVDLINWAADWILPTQELEGYNHATGTALLGRLSVVSTPPSTLREEEKLVNSSFT